MTTQEISKLGNLGRYLLAFGEVQAQWLASRTVPRLTLPQRLVFRSGVPSMIQQWFALRSGVVVSRSAIPGGHKLEIFADGELIDAADFILGEKGWTKQ